MSQQQKGSELNYFTITSLENGKAIEKLNNAVKMAALDIKNRPDVKKPRVVTFTLSMMPHEGLTKVQGHAKYALPPDLPMSTLCGKPDEDGNLFNIQTQADSGQYSLPINFVSSEEQ